MMSSDSTAKFPESSGRPVVYTAQQVAEILQVDVRTVQRLTSSGALPHRALAGQQRHARYTPDDIETFLSRQYRIGRGADVEIVPAPRRRRR